MATPDTLYRNARVFTAAADPWTDAVATAGDRIVAVGAAALSAAGPATAVIDLDGAFVIPGITDAHFHTLMAGEAIRRANLVRARDLAEIQQLVRAWADANPSSAWVLGRGWLHSSIPSGAPTRQMLDAVVADRPVSLDANDLHSAWVNTLGLELLGITRDTPDPAGGEIVRDADGEPTGELKETAVLQTWEYFSGITTDEQRTRSWRRRSERSPRPASARSSRWR